MRVLAFLLVLWATAVPAQEGLAQFLPEGSGIVAAGDGVRVELVLSQAVPWRVFTLDDPARLVVDFREVDFQGADPDALRGTEGVTDRVSGLRMGPFAPGWSRMVVDLAGPFAVKTAGMTVSGAEAEARIAVDLAPVSAEAFAAASGPPVTGDWPEPRRGTPEPPPPGNPDVIVVAIDPGHGGLDPGAEHGGAREADLMLDVGLELAEAVARAGMVPVLTRAEDRFVPLPTRMTIAREAGADLLISLHADALEGEQATGASVYTLTRTGEAEANTRLAETHGRGDLLAGLDLAGQDDQVAEVLMELARLETGPASRRLTSALVAAMGQGGVPLHSRPERTAVLAVLEAPDFPSVLIETGYMSHVADRARLTSPEGRAPLVEAIVKGIEAWAAGEAARAPLQRR